MPASPPVPYLSPLFWDSAHTESPDSSSHCSGILLRDSNVLPDLTPWTISYLPALKVHAKLPHWREWSSSTGHSRTHSQKVPCTVLLPTSPPGLPVRSLRQSAVQGSLPHFYLPKQYPPSQVSLETHNFLRRSDTACSSASFLPPQSSVRSPGQILE